MQAAGQLIVLLGAPREDAFSHVGDCKRCAAGGHPLFREAAGACCGGGEGREGGEVVFVGEEGLRGLTACEGVGRSAEIIDVEGRGVAG